MWASEWMCVRVYWEMCACVERHMWYLFRYLKRKPNVPMCRSTCGPKNSSLSSCHTQAVRLTRTLHFSYLCAAHYWKPKWQRNENVELLTKANSCWVSEMCVNCLFCRSVVMFVDTSHHLDLLYALVLFLSSYVCTSLF